MIYTLCYGSTLYFWLLIMHTVMSWYVKCRCCRCWDKQVCEGHAFEVSRVAEPLAAVNVKRLMRFDFNPGKTLYHVKLLSCICRYTALRC